MYQNIEIGGNNMFEVQENDLQNTLDQALKNIDSNELQNNKRVSDSKSFDSVNDSSSCKKSDQDQSSSRINENINILVRPPSGLLD